MDNSTTAGADSDNETDDDAVNATAQEPVAPILKYIKKAHPYQLYRIAKDFHGLPTLTHE